MNKDAPVSAAVCAPLAASTAKWPAAKRPREMAARLTIAYTADEIDPGLSFKDEGPPRMALLRTVLRVADNAASRTLLNPCSSAGLAALLWPKESTSQRQRNMDSIMLNSASLQAQVCLLKPTLRTYTPEEADALAKGERLSCFGVRRTNLVVLPGSFATNPVCFIELRCARRKAKFARSSASAIKIESEGRRMFLRLNGCANAAMLIDRLFKPANAPVCARPLALREPPTAQDVPDCLAEALADCLKQHFRLHALFDAAQNSGSRPLCLDRTVLCENAKDPGDGRPITRVDVYFHASCASCICPAWGRPRKNGGFVRCEIKVCGKNAWACARLENSNHAQPNGDPTMSDGAPGMCSAGLDVRVRCWHPSDYRAGILVCLAPTARARAELLALIFAIRNFQYMRRSASSQPMAALLAKCEASLAVALAKVRQAHPDSPPLSNSDALCTGLLRRGGVTRGPPNRRTATVPRIVNREPGAAALSTAELELKNTHLMLFPPFSLYQGKPATARAATDATALPEQGAPKRQRRGDEEVLDLVEYVDVEWAAEALRQAELGMVDEALQEGQRACATFFANYTMAILEKCGPEQLSSENRLVRPLHVRYRRKHNGGRFFADQSSGLYDGRKCETRGLNCQAAPSLLRQFFYRGDHDLDQANSQMQILLQMCSRLTWTDGTKAPTLAGLKDWCENRAAFIEDVSQWHGLPPDSERWTDARKDDIKLLILSLTFGSVYGSWVRNTLYKKIKGVPLPPGHSEPEHPRVVRFQKDMQQVRECVFRSDQWKPFVERDRARMARDPV